MIIYMVTTRADNAIAADYGKWMQNEHIAEMMATGLFFGYTFSTQTEPADKDQTIFVLQLQCAGNKEYQEYITLHSPALRQKGIVRFGDSFSSSRLVLQVIE